MKPPQEQGVVLSVIIFDVPNYYLCVLMNDFLEEEREMKAAPCHHDQNVLIYPERASHLSSSLRVLRFASRYPLFVVLRGSNFWKPLGWRTGPGFKVYLPCILASKKRYVGFMYESPKDLKPSFDAKVMQLWSSAVSWGPCHHECNLVYIMTLALEDILVPQSRFRECSSFSLETRNMFCTLFILVRMFPKALMLLSKQSSPHRPPTNFRKTHRPLRTIVETLSHALRRCAYFFRETSSARRQGIETVRRDGCPLVVKMLEKVLRILFTTRDLSQIKGYLYRQWTRILTDRAAVGDFIFAKEVRTIHNNPTFRFDDQMTPGSFLTMFERLAIIQPPGLLPSSWILVF